jgi:hypothetical protein
VRVAAAALVLALASCIAPAPRPQLADRGPDRVWDPDLVCDDGGRAYAVALTRTTGGEVGFLFATTPSADAWTVSDPAPFGRAPRGRRRPRLAAGRDGEVFCAWEDARSGPIDLYFNRSLDAGATWLPADVRLNTNAPGISHLAAPALVCDDVGRVYAVWRDDRDGFDAFYCNASRDHGASWRERDVRITGISLGRKHEPRVACDRHGNVYVAWIDLRDGTQRVAFNASYDAGETWMLQDVALGDGGGVFALELIAFDDGTLVATWAEGGAGGRRVFVARSSDGGRFWSAPRPLEIGEVVGDASAPQIVTDQRRNVYIAWYATGFDGNGRIAVATTDDGGVSYTFTTVRLPEALLDPDAYGPRRGLLAPFGLACDGGGNVYLSWIERGAGSVQVGIDRVGAFGRTWMRLSPPLGLSTYAPADAFPPRLACDDYGHVYMLWNGGHALHAATSPFYAESGWRHQSF